MQILAKWMLDFLPKKNYLNNAKLFLFDYQLSTLIWCKQKFCYDSLYNMPRCKGQQSDKKFQCLTQFSPKSLVNLMKLLEQLRI